MIDPERRSRRRRDALVLGALLFLHAWLALASSRTQSLTIDEHVYLAAGMAHVFRADDRLNPEQPPLAKVFAALPGVGGRPEWDARDPDWSRASAWRDLVAWRLPSDLGPVRASVRAEWPFSARFLYETNRERLAAWVFWGRAIFVLLSCLTGLVVFVWARREWGGWGAGVALAFYAGSPTALAHAGLLITDGPFTLFHTLFALGLYRLLTEQRRSPWPYALGVALALLLALLTKHSGLVLIGVGGVCGVWFGRRGPARRRLVPLGAALALGLFAVPLVLQLWFGRSSYGIGVQMVLARLMSDVGRPAFLGGALSDRFPHYFVVAAALKASLPFVVGVVAAVAWSAQRGRWRDPALGYLLALSGGLFLLTSWRYPNLGVRYLLPILPLVCLVLGCLAARVSARARGGVVALAGAHLLSAILAFPTYLSYGNLLTGRVGVAGWLDESNLDWGQDLPALARWCEASGVGALYLLQYGIADPTFYGAPAVQVRPQDLRTLPPGSTVAISVSFLQRDRAIRDQATRWKRLAIVNETLYVFRVPG